MPELGARQSLRSSVLLATEYPVRPIQVWGKPLFFISGNCALDVRNLAASRDWYEEKLGLREARNDRENSSGRPFVDLCISSDNAFVSLVELEPNTNAENGHVIFFAKNLEKAHKWLAEAEYPSSQSRLTQVGTVSFDLGI